MHDAGGVDRELERLGDQIVLVLHLPLAAKGDVDLAERGNELIITVGPYRRVLALPGALQRYGIAGAGLVDGVLRVRFRPHDKGRQR